MTQQYLWDNLAAFFNAAEIVPQGEGAEPPIPRSLYDEDGIWGISYRFNGGNARWFTVGGPDEDEGIRTP